MPPVLAVGSTPVPTDVVQTGRIKPQPLVTHTFLIPGYTIGSVRLNGSGTFGAVVKCGKADELLGNSHVLADGATGKKGDAILSTTTQPPVELIATVDGRWMICRGEPSPSPCSARARSTSHSFAKRRCS
jgi:hypothetical protein